MKNSGLVYIFTGEGKGKTSAALGMLTRALAHGWKVGWVSWYKEERWGISEHRLSEILTEEAQKRLFFFPMGKGFYLPNEKQVRTHAAVIIDDDSLDDHKKAAQEALQKAESLIPEVDVLFLDEVCNAVHDGLLEEDELMYMIQQRGKTHVILTGRDASAQLQGIADLVSVIHKQKHPFDSGKLAVKGLDF